MCIAAFAQNDPIPHSELHQLWSTAVMELHDMSTTASGAVPTTVSADVRPDGRLRRLNNDRRATHIPPRQYYC